MTGIEQKEHTSLLKGQDDLSVQATLFCQGKLTFKAEVDSMYRDANSLKELLILTEIQVIRYWQLVKT